MVNENDKNHNHNPQLISNTRYFITATFRRDMAIDSQHSAKQQIDGILNDLALLSAQSNIELIVSWSLVYHHDSYHAHITTNWLPESVRTYLTYRRKEINRAPLTGILNTHKSYTDNPKKRIQKIKRGDENRVLGYMANQPRGGDVLETEFLHIVRINSDLLRSENDCSRHYSSHENLQLSETTKNLSKICSLCGQEKPYTIDYFPPHSDKRLRSQCYRCRKVSKAATNADSSARRYETAHGLEIGSLGYISTVQAYDVYLSQIDNDGILQDGLVHAPLDWQFMSIDHLIPFSHGGLNSVDNICFTRKRFNSIKSNDGKHVYQWRFAKHGVLVRHADSDVTVQKKLFE